MSDHGTDKPPGLSTGQILKLAVGIVAFGALMAVRTELDRIWVRALVAACAAGILAWAVLQARRGKG